MRKARKLTPEQAIATFQAASSKLRAMGVSVRPPVEAMAIQRRDARADEERALFVRGASLTRAFFKAFEWDLSR